MPELDMSEFLFLLLELKNIPIFQYLNENEKRERLRYAKTVTLPKTQKIFTQGEQDKKLYMVISGILKASWCNEDQQEVLLFTINPGEYFGEECLFIDTVRFFDVQVVSEYSKIMSINRQNFYHFIHTCPGGGVKILLLMLNHLFKKSHRGENLLPKQAVLPEQSILEKEIIQLLTLLR